MPKAKQIKDGSVAVENLNYNGNDAVLTVEFTTRGRYEYYNVDRATAAKVMGAESLGRAFHAFIRGKFDYECIA